MPDYKIVDAEKLDADLKYVADKIRAKSGTTEEMDFPLGYGEVVDAIQKGENLDTELSEQESLIAELEAVLDSKASASVNLQEKTVTPDTTEQTITPDDEYDGLSKVTVEAIPAEYIIPSGTKEITENGEHDVTNYAKVDVNVKTGGGSSGENKLAKVMGNKSVEILAEDLEGVTSLRNYAFYGNTNLGNVTIPATVKTIGSGAFYNCRNMMYLRFPNHTSVPTLSNSNALSGTNADLQILVPANLLDAWKAASNWTSHASKIFSI
jgi:hypothetical protein